uniref:Uncharacterized protein n=1 Tax=Picea sitchensis TaxID=3332 RepID=A9P084_PICSI|nr:unknown [Picea sitchensis]
MIIQKTRKTRRMIVKRRRLLRERKVRPIKKDRELQLINTVRIVCRRCLKIFFSNSRGLRSNGGRQ